MNEYPWARRCTNSRRPTARDKETGQRIRWHRQLKGMTLAILAQAIGISLQQLAKYESGQNKIDASGLESIAKIFQVPTEDLLQRSPFEAGLTEVGFSLGDLLHEPLVIRLLRAWDRIECFEHRAILLQLIKSFDQVNTAVPNDEHNLCEKIEMHINLYAVQRDGRG
jgi:transcriptional regulator with XRE-family HTH domain